MNYNNSTLKITTQTSNHYVKWQSPSNLAIVKYWGKYGIQLPRNASISFTLNDAHTKTSIKTSEKEDDNKIAISFLFEKSENTAFKVKIEQFLQTLIPVFPFLTQLHLAIESENTFPHSAGIASSASAMSALALCLCDLEQQLFNTLPTEQAFLQKASFIARLGSGSACRSLYPTVAIWGDVPEIEETSNLYAIPYENAVHDLFKTYHDDILLVSKEEKKVSSRAGHALMENNAYASVRYQQANQRLNTLLTAMKVGDLETFGEIAENEALTLHALMMASNPSYILMAPNSLILIDKVRTFRKETKTPLYFSLDAGPNLHLLYPDENKEIVTSFIQTELLQFCNNKQYIPDTVGQGAVKC